MILKGGDRAPGGPCLSPPVTVTGWVTFSFGGHSTASRLESLQQASAGWRWQPPEGSLSVSLTGICFPVILLFLSGGKAGNSSSAAGLSLYHCPPPYPLCLADSHPAGRPGARCCVQGLGQGAGTGLCRSARTEPRFSLALPRGFTAQTEWGDPTVAPASGLPSSPPKGVGGCI